MTNNTTPPAKTIDNAQLYWDDQDPRAAGWYLRYRVNGTEEGTAIDGAEDDSTEDLAQRVADHLDTYGRVTVRIGEGTGRRCTVDGGKVVDWRTA